MNARTFVHCSTALSVLTFSLLSFSTPFSSPVDPASEWHLLYSNIRDRLISKEEARQRLKALETLLRDRYSKEVKPGEVPCFPLKGYDVYSIGGKGGSGYQVRGYDFFDGNLHKGHPGHDLFIRDKNQDGLDDATGKPVEVVSASSGVVVSVNLNWEPSSPLRGGNYVWIYEPVKCRNLYYAHLNRIFVRVGQIVVKGERLGTVGRTGLNAYPKRSPTHLHFVVHQSTEGYPKPINPYWEWVRMVSHP